MRVMHLSEYMEVHQLRDQDVADAIACSRPTVSRIRRRMVRPDWGTIEKIKTFTKGQSTADDYTSLAEEVG
jgi:DNA-directed RNA polymerase specialized sigma54-like protein